MKYTVTLSLKDLPSFIRVMDTQAKAATLMSLELTKLLEEHPELTPGLPEGGGKEEFMRVRFVRDGVDIGFIEAAPKAGAAKQVNIQRPLTGKYKAFRLFLTKAVTSDFLAKEILGVIGEVMKGTHAMDSGLGGYTVGELLAVPGFFKDERIITTMVSTFVGRLANVAAKNQFRINLTEPMDRMNAIRAMECTTTVELQAIKQIMAKAVAKFGEPALYDKAAADALIAKHDAMIREQVGHMMV